MKSTELPKRIITSVILLTILGLMYLYPYILISVLLIFSFLSFFEFNVLINKIFKNKNFINLFIKFIISLIGLIYITFFSFIMFSAFSTFEDKVLFSFTLSVCIGSDLGGIIFGKIFKGKKLTKISPNKTIAGSLGSFMLSLCLVPIFHFLLADQFLNLLSLILLATLVSFFCQIGDLFISYLKRKAKVKDTGDILPGHGGLLDRIDGMILAIPLGMFIWEFLIVVI